MRRSDREVTEIEEIIGIVEKCDVCRVAMSDDGKPYIVPMNFGYDYVGGRLTLYFHCAKTGKKLDIIKENPYVCFEMDCSHSLIDGGDTACKYGMAFESVIGTGNIYMCAGREEKRKGLAALMGKYTPGKRFAFTDEDIESVAVLKLVAGDFTAKRHL